MTRLIKTFHKHYVSPFGLAMATSIDLNKRLWTGGFAQAWDSLPLDERLVWLAFVGNTICIFTLIEFLFLKK